MTFAVGTQVEHRTFGRGTVVFGPFDHYNGPDHYLMEGQDGDHALVESSALTDKTTLSIGDVVRSVGGAHYTVKAGPFYGVAFEWYVLADDDGVDYQSNRGSLTLVTSAPATGYEYKGRTYEYGAVYVDDDRDRWAFSRPVGGDEPRSDNESYHAGRTLPDVVDSYGPLTAR